MHIFFSFLRFFFENLLFIYGVSIMLSYIVLAFLSASALIRYKKRNSFVDYSALLKSPICPSISILAPAYNESKTIIENVHSLLSLNYTAFEVVLVNDGSTDDSLQKIINEFELEKVNFLVDEKIPTQPIKAIYKSRRDVFSKLIVVDKENGGKSDALNAAINISNKDYFITIDVDCVMEQDALVKMAKPFIEQTKKRVIASGGVIRVANSCTVKNGNLVEVNVPKKLLPKFQVLEYFRAFVLGRMAWSRLNGLLLISGAFGMFDKEIVIKAGGYSTRTVGEDMELVVRMRRYMHENNMGKYIVAFIPDPLCWTEVPETQKVLGRQRNRWTRGTIEVLFLHKKLFLNPSYGRLGVISYLFWFLFEWMAPFVEFFGIMYFILLILVGKVNFLFFLLMLGLIYTFAISFSLCAIFFEEIYFHQYKKKGDAFKLVFAALLEPFLHHPVLVFYALKGNYDFFILKRHGWGDMKRVGFTIAEKRKKRDSDEDII
ncbi:MAG: glycosyltransferase [Bacteroidales bacterium]|nr:glycosyltransferase [Bacteroidales bacterium]